MRRRSTPPFKTRPAEAAASLSDTLSGLRPRHTEVPVEDEASGWALTFGDFVLLMLCFFVVWNIAEKQQLLAQIELADLTKPAVPALYAKLAPQAKITVQAPSGQNIPDIPIKQVELAKLAKQAEQPASEERTALGKPTASGLSPAHLPSLIPQPEIVSIQPPVQPAQPTSVYSQEDTYSKAQKPLQPVPILVPLVPQAATPTPDQSWQVLAGQIEQYLDEHEFEHMAGVVSSEHELIISLSDMITFPSGEATLDSGVIPVLEYVAQLAETKPQLLVEIAGHTDDRPIATAAFPSNWELSTARASRVARALLDLSGINPVRISTRGYAYHRPLYENDSDEHRAANRRVEIRFFHPLASPSIVRETTQAATVPFHRNLALNGEEHRPLSQ